MVQRAVNYLFGFYEKCLIPCAHILNQTARRIDCNSLHMHFSWTFSCILVVGQSLSFVRLFATPWLQHTRLPSPSPSPGVCSNSCPLSRWCHPTISSSVVPFSSCPQSLLASGSFPVSQLFSWGGQSFWSFSFSISPSNEYSRLISFRIDWFDLVVQGTLKCLLQHLKSSTVWKHQFLGSQPSLWSNSDIHSWLWKSNSFDVCQQSDVSAFSYTV